VDLMFKEAAVLLLYLILPEPVPLVMVVAAGGVFGVVNEVRPVDFGVDIETEVAGVEEVLLFMMTFLTATAAGSLGVLVVTTLGSLGSKNLSTYVDVVIFSGSMKSFLR